MSSCWITSNLVFLCSFAGTLCCISWGTSSFWTAGEWLRESSWRQRPGEHSWRWSNPKSSRSVVIDCCCYIKSYFLWLTAKLHLRCPLKVWAQMFTTYQHVFLQQFCNTFCHLSLQILQYKSWPWPFVSLRCRRLSFSCLTHLMQRVVKMCSYK